MFLKKRVKKYIWLPWMEAGNSRSFQRQVEKALATHSSTLAWKTHGRRSLVGCSPWGSEELDTTERLHFHFSLARIGEGNGNPVLFFDCSD